MHWTNATIQFSLQRILSETCMFMMQTADIPLLEFTEQRPVLDAIMLGTNQRRSLVDNGNVPAAPEYKEEHD